MNLWEIRALYMEPQIELHPYYNIYIIVEYENKDLIYQVDWDYSGSRGLEIRVDKFNNN